MIPHKKLVQFNTKLDMDRKKKYINTYLKTKMFIPVSLQVQLVMES